MTTSETSPTAEFVERNASSTELKAGELGLFDSVAVATASTAPAYSLASTLALVVAIGGVGLRSPSIVLVSFIVVLPIAVAYYYLNRKDPNCGASYAWLGRTVSPYLGWYNGWVQVLASALFMAAAPVVAGQNTLTFLNNIGIVSAGAVSSAKWQALVGILWLILITGMCVYGIRLTTDFQWVLLAIEYVTVVLFSVYAIIEVIASHPHGFTSFSLQWFNPFGVSNVTALSAGLVLGVFFFWGWDTASNLNEETKDANETPGKAGIISMFLLLVVFALNAVAVQMRIPSKEIISQNSSALYDFAHTLSAPLSVVMLLAILSSTVATAQTTLLPAARITYAMARDGVFPSYFGKVSPKYKTPAIGTIILGALALVLIVITTYVSSAGSVLTNLITDIGVLVGFYYGASGLACAWAYRKSYKESPKRLIFAGILPALAGLVLFYVGYEVIVSSVHVAIPVLVLMGIGIPLVVIARLTNKTGYFQQKTVSYLD